MLQPTQQGKYVVTLFLIMEPERIIQITTISLEIS